ncbi:MAG: peptidylprolyl isomerase [Bacillota bacterium]
MKHKRTKKKSRKPDHTVQRSQSHSDWLWPLVVLIILALAAGLWWAHKRKQGEMASVVDKVRIETNKGTIVLGVYSDNVPLTAKNFVDLVSSGFYDGLIWHRVEDWVVQTGDPEGTGRGGSDKTIKLEVDPDLKNTRGMVGMARKDDPDSATSQFYILKSDAPWLDESYAVFAKVMEGMDVVDSLEIGDRMITVTRETSD